MRGCANLSKNGTAIAAKHGNTETFVTLTVQNGTARLHVADDGPGFPDGFDPLIASNTGLDLVENMARWDLQGQTFYTRGPAGGGSVSVTFAVAEE